MPANGKTIKGVHKSNEPSTNRFTLTFDPSWIDPPKRAFKGSYKLILTPSGSKAKPRVGCFQNNSLVFSAGARNTCYEMLLSIVDQKIATSCEKRESLSGKGHYLLIELDPDFLLNPKKTYILDTETTGIDKTRDEILSLAIVDLDGNELFHDFIKPRKKQSWPEAQLVNHISPDMVKSAKHLDERMDEISFLLDESALIIGYNIDFDLAILRNSGLPVVNHYTYDVMTRFADKHANGRYKKLNEAASCYGYSFSPHNALDDAKATAHIFRNMEKLTDNPISYKKKTQSGSRNTDTVKATQTSAKFQSNSRQEVKVDPGTSCGCVCIGLAIFIGILIAIFNAIHV